MIGKPTPPLASATQSKGLIAWADVALLRATATALAVLTPATIGAAKLTGGNAFTGQQTVTGSVDISADLDVGGNVYAGGTVDAPGINLNGVPLGTAATATIGTTAGQLHANGATLSASTIAATGAIETNGPNGEFVFKDRVSGNRWVWYSPSGQARLYSQQASKDVITVDGSTGILNFGSGIVGSTATFTGQLNVTHNGSVAVFNHATDGSVVLNRTATVYNGFSFQDSGVEKWFIGQINGANNLVFRRGAATNYATLFDTTGNLAIGTTTDNGTDKLQVTASANITGNVTAGGGAFTAAALPTSTGATENLHGLFTDSAGNRILAIRSQYNGRGTRYYGSASRYRMDAFIDTVLNKACFTPYDDTGGVPLPFEVRSSTFAVKTAAAGDPTVDRFTIDATGNGTFSGSVTAAGATFTSTAGVRNAGDWTLFYVTPSAANRVGAMIFNPYTASGTLTPTTPQFFLGQNVNTHGNLSLWRYDQSRGHSTDDITIDANGGVTVKRATTLTNTLAGTSATLNGNLAFTGGGAGSARNINFGTGYGSAALTLYDGGAGGRYGWGLNGSEMQFHIPSGGTNRWTFNSGGDHQASGVNEAARLYYNGAFETQGYVSAANNGTFGGYVSASSVGSRFAVSTSLVADGSLANGTLTFGLDGSGNIVIKAKDAGGTVRTGTVTLA